MCKGATEKVQQDYFRYTPLKSTSELAYGIVYKELLVVLSNSLALFIHPDNFVVSC